MPICVVCATGSLNLSYRKKAARQIDQEQGIPTSIQRDSAPFHSASCQDNKVLLDRLIRQGLTLWFENPWLAGNLQNPPNEMEVLLGNLSNLMEEFPAHHV